MPRGRPKGGKKFGGRAKGTPNHNTAMLKDAILEAARLAGNDLAGDGAGIVGYLQIQAKTNPGPFLTIMGKVIPTQITGEGDGPLQIIVKRFSEVDD